MQRLTFLLLWVVVVRVGAQVPEKEAALYQQLLAHPVEDAQRLRILNRLTSTILNSDFNKAYALSCEAEGLARRLNDKAGLAEALDNRGSLETLQGRYTEGLLHLEEARSLYQLAGDSIGLGYVLSSIGETLTQFDSSFQKGVSVLFEAMQVAEAIGNADIYTEVLNALGVAHAYRNLYTEAREFFEKSLVINRQDTSTFGQSGVARDLANIGACWVQQKAYTRALPVLKEAWDVARAEDHDRLLIIIHGNLATIYYSIDQLAEARHHAWAALPLLGQFDDPDMSGSLFNVLALIHTKGKQTDSMFYYLSKAQALAADMGDLQFLAQVTETAYKSHKSVGDWKRALLMLEQFKELDDSVRRREQFLYVQHIRTRYEVEKKEQAMFIMSQDVRLQKQQSQFFRSLATVIATGLLLAFLGILFWLRKQQRYALEMSALRASLQLKAQREKLSRNLHDGLGGHLTSIEIGLNRIAERKEYGKIADVHSLTTQAIQELRNSLWALEREEMSVEDLGYRIQSFFWNYQKLDLPVHFNMEVEESILPKRLPADMIADIYRIVQEAIHNALKHSEASSIDVHLSNGDATLKLQIRDNGRGFDTGAIDELTHFGIRNMKVRAQKWGGTLSIESRPGGGVMVLVGVPI